MAIAQDKQKLGADQKGRRNNYVFQKGDLVLLSVKDIPTATLEKFLPTFVNTKLLPRYLGPYPVEEQVNERAYRLTLPSSLRLHPVFYVRLLKPYYSSASPPSPMADLEEGIELQSQDLQSSDLQHQRMQADALHSSPVANREYYPPHPKDGQDDAVACHDSCLLYTSPSPRD